MEFADIKGVLLEENFIDNIITRNEKQYADKEYDLVIRCDLIVDEMTVPIVVGIPTVWETKLFDFYVRDYDSFPFIPHVERYGKICLFDMEGVLIDDQFDGLLLQCFKQAANVISDGLSGKNSIDFIKEFDAYWGRLPKCGNVRFAVPEEKINARIYFDYWRGKSDNQICALAGIQGTEVLRDWGVKRTLYRGGYVFIESPTYIYPPDSRTCNLTNFINRILQNIDFHEIKNIIKHDDKPLIIFEIKQPNDQAVFICVYTEKGEISRSGNYYQFTEDSILYPLLVSRIDKAFLMSRTETGENPLKDMKALIIGAGSIGGYLASFLSKAGCERITLVDNDIYTEENIYRHILGRDSIGRYKAEALAKKLQEEIPSLRVSTYIDQIETIVQEGSVDLTEYDVIFSATGNHNVNRWINKYIVQNAIDIPVIYVWNEPLDIGYHTAIVRSDRIGSFEDLFYRNDRTGELMDGTAFCSSDQIITRNMAGCGGSFIPYGSEVSILSAESAIDMLKRYATGRVNYNEVVSYKGEGFYFKNAGLRATEIFEKQREVIARKRITELL